MGGCLCQVPDNRPKRKSRILVRISATVLHGVHRLKMRCQPRRKAVQIVLYARQFIPASHIVGHANQQCVPAVMQ